MIIYSVEIYLKKDICKNWYQWMRTKHIPDIMKTNLFKRFTFYENLTNEEMCNHIIQYHATSFDKYIKYQQEHQKQFQKEHSFKFKDKFFAKRSLFIQIN